LNILTSYRFELMFFNDLPVSLLNTLRLEKREKNGLRKREREREGEKLDTYNVNNFVHFTMCYALSLNGR